MTRTSNWQLVWLICQTLQVEEWSWRSPRPRLCTSGQRQGLTNGRCQQMSTCTCRRGTMRTTDSMIGSSTPFAHMPGRGKHTWRRTMDIVMPFTRHQPRLLPAGSPGTVCPENLSAATKTTTSTRSRRHSAPLNIRVEMPP